MMVTPGRLRAGGIRGGGAAAFVSRATPTGIPTLPFTLTGLSGYGRNAATISRNAARACEATLTYTNASISTAVTNGTTFNTWLQTGTESYARITANTTLSINGSQGLRNTHGSQSAGVRVKHLIADGCTVTINIAPPATDVAGLTYALDGGGSDVYIATMVSAAFPHRMFRTDQTDAWGFAKQLRKYTTLATLQAASSGWFRSGTSLYVKLGTGVNVNTNKAILAAKWMDTGGTSRLQLLGAAMCLEAINGGSIVFDGVQIALSEAVSRRPEFWAHGVEIRHPASGGIGSTTPFGGRAVLTSSTMFSSEVDGINLSANSVNTGQGLIVTANCLFRDCGSIDASGANGTLQGISAHGGVDHVSFGSTFEFCNAPGVADTIATGTTGASWLVGCEFGDDVSASNTGCVMGSGSGGTRAAWIDSCRDTVNGTALSVQTGATVKVYNNQFTGAVSGSTTTYAPGSP